ncbi:uncharacterized protein LOC143462322 isoform X1 [Clavelina lepadiformis]|uniref:uncharacterized protein LOC143462322 isoform X1 n=1 Tax=Clavelina lepadiformis TaxID=159417 RepID=UPI004041E648
MFYWLMVLMIYLSQVDGHSDEVCLSLSRGQDDLAPRETIQGPPGRRGPEGPPGPVGENGLPGQCDCSEIDELKKEIQALNDSCIGGVIYHNSCIKLAYLHGRRVSYMEAVRLCAEMNASLAEITSDRMFDLVVNYINQTWGEFSHRSDLVNVWLGMTYQINNNPRHLLTIPSTDSQVATNRWFPGYPTSTNHHTTVLIEIGTISARATGIFNYYRSTYSSVPFCSRLLKGMI